MSKPILAIDLDDTLKEFMKGFLAYHQRVHGFSKPFEEMTDFTFWPLLKIPDREEAIRRVTDFYSSPEGCKSPALPHSQEILTRLQQKYDFIVVTSRSEDARTQTTDWVERNFSGLFRDIYFTNNWSMGSHPSQRKANLCKRIGACALIDDSPEYVGECRREGIPAFLISRPWNEKKDSSGTNWRELEATLQTAQF